MSDHILRAITSDGLVQAAAISSRDLTERARQIHKTLPVATAALGRTLAGASMMGNALKGHGASLTLQIKGSGPLGTILAVSDSDGNVRGYVTNPQTELPLRPDGKLDVRELAYTELVLEVPTVLLCSDDCAGLCPVCGNRKPCSCRHETSGSVDERLSILKQLLND